MVSSELMRNIPACIEEKSRKIANRADDYGDWWLLLVDHISPVPKFGLSESELAILKKEVSVSKPWSRIIIISSKNPNWSYEL